MDIYGFDVKPDHLLYAGAAGIFLGITFLMVMLYRRIRWALGLLSRHRRPSPGLIASLGRLILIALWTSFFGMVLFLGFFLRSYHTFTYEKPVASIEIQALERMEKGSVATLEFSSVESKATRKFLVKGDQWMVEGDFLKWDNWITFVFGLESRYRLTRIRGRYLDTEAERHRPGTVHSLVAEESHPLWRYLYRYGHRLPSVSTVYGSAAFQDLKPHKKYEIFVGTSGFIVKEKD